MRKMNILITASFVLLTAVVTGYYFLVIRQETMVVAPVRPPAQLPSPAAPPERARPDHGDFEKRFQPVPPPPNGGKLN